MASVFSLILICFEKIMTKNQKITNFAALILAAGNSSRMGTSKHALKFDDNHTFAEKIISQAFDFGCQKTAIVLNSNDAKNFKSGIPAEKLTLVINPYPEKGRFYSIKLGLESLNFAGYVFVINVDNPFFQTETLFNLSDKIPDFEVAIPVYQGMRGHPVLLSPDVVRKAILQTDISLQFRDFLTRFNQVFVEVEDRHILTNINTPEDYESFCKR